MKQIQFYEKIQLFIVRCLLRQQLVGKYYNQVRIIKIHNYYVLIVK